MFRYNINPDSEIPVYRQLVDQINAQIRSGALKTGTQLPTVREMADLLHLSCGTVKRVYDCLRDMGDIEMTRRRGTFVKYVRSDKDSRKLQAMTAIDRMMRSLSDLNFSPAEIQIFLSLKMREWGLRWSGIRVALVTDCPELAPVLDAQLARLGNVKVIFCETRQLREYPYSIDEESDVILASAQDSQKILPHLPDKSKLIKVAFSVRPESLVALVCASHRKLGVMCLQDDFAALVRDHLPAVSRDELRIVKSGDGLDEFDALVLPPEWEKVFRPEDAARLKAVEKIIFDYSIDEGSMIYLEERINRIRDERQLQPGSLMF